MSTAQPATPATSTLPAQMRALAQAARAAARKMATATRAQKDAALAYAGEALLARRAGIEQANAEDLSRAKERGLSGPMLDRLKLDLPVLQRLAEGLKQVAELNDPIGQELSRETRPNGLVLRRVRVPIGTILIIFESRPNVTVEAGSLCLKSGNACILRGGSEARASNAVLAEALREGLERAGLPADAVLAPPTADRAAITELLQLDDLIDLAIPRGGESLIRAVAEQSRIPVIKHYKGVCHVYVHADADPDLAVKIAVNSKLQRVSVCNAAETLLVHQDLAKTLLPEIARALLSGGCELRAEPKAKAALEAAGIAQAKDAGPDAFHSEYLDKILSLKLVGSLEEAVDHIETYGSRHTETIVTRDAAAGQRFQQLVDSASVFVNASTRLADGFEYGLGAEIGISTDKLHARGPMGLDELTTYKWLGDGTGQLRG
ncbi:MAG: glutamate-5-semialdehyde dehydrogenase [Planctomycetota bacterium]|nr:glutamate-5-semialdehyde dehydrogenase [Planctomycetota bacterium]